MVEQWKNIKSIDKALPSRKVEPFVGVDQVDGTMFLGVNFVLKQAHLVKDWKTEFGVKSFYVCLCEYEDSKGQLKTVSTILPGQPVFDMITELLEHKALPVLCRLNMVDTKDGSKSYYILDKPVEATGAAGS